LQYFGNIRKLTGLPTGKAAGEIALSIGLALHQLWREGAARYKPTRIFVLSNYFGSKWMELREESEYQKVVRSAQERCWSAYAFSTAMEWKSPVNWQEFGFIPNWKANIIWSQIINKQN
jgi:hypothetical protein